MKYKALATIVLLLLPLISIPLSFGNQPNFNVEFRIRPGKVVYTGPCIVSTEFPIDVYLWNDKTLTGVGVYAYDFYVWWKGDQGINMTGFENHIPWPDGSFFLVENKTGSGPAPWKWYHLAVTAYGNSTINPSLELGATGVFNASLVTLTFHIDKEPCWPDIYSTFIGIGNKDGADQIAPYLNPLYLPTAVTGCGQKITNLEIDQGKYTVYSSQPNIDPELSEAPPYATNINATTVGQTFSIYIHLTNIVNAYGFDFTLTFDPLWKQTDIQKVTILPAFAPPYETLAMTVNNNTGVIHFELIRPCEKPTIHGADVPVVKIDFVETATPILPANKTFAVVPYNHTGTIAITDAHLYSKCGTLREPDNRVYDFAQYNAAIAAADRLVALLSDKDFGWDWIVTGLTAHTGLTSAWNIYGVTALDLIHAYEMTGNEDYIDAAAAIAAYMAYGDPSIGDFRNGNGIVHWGMSFDYRFLMEMGYSTYAKAAWKWDKANTARFAGADNFTKSVTLFNFYFGSSDPGYAYWSLADWGMAFQALGDIAMANETAERLAYNLVFLLTEAQGLNNYPVLGLGHTLEFFANSPYIADHYPLAVDQIITALEAFQNPTTGVFQQGAPLADSVQSTAYAVMGLWAAGEDDAAQAGADWLVANQLANGGWLDGSVEYSEVDSEAMSALLLPQNHWLIYSGDIGNNLRPKSRADLNLDGIVDIADLSAVAKWYGKTHGYSALAASTTAPVDIFDLVYVAKRYGDP